MSCLLEHSDSGKNNSIRFGSIHADESIFRFDSIRQFDKTDACTLIVTHAYRRILYVLYVYKLVV